jgi:hypothetical protein
MAANYDETEMAEETYPPEADWRDAHRGNGAAAEPDMDEESMEMEAVAVETVEMEYAEAEAPVAGEEDHIEEAEAAEDAEEEPKGGLAGRFAARRAKRNAGKSGSSLTSRLRGLVSDSPETRT